MANSKISKTSINLSDKSREKLAELTEQMGLSQTQIIEALLSQVETGRIVFEWKQQQPAKVKSAKSKSKS